MILDKFRENAREREIEEERERERGRVHERGSYIIRGEKRKDDRIKKRKKKRKKRNNALRPKGANLHPRAVLVTV